MRDPLLIQFAKWPEKGRVKTRLAATLGEQGAVDAHIRLTGCVLENLAATGYPLTLWWNRPLPPASDEATPILERIAEKGVSQGVQQGSDLGERMHHALASGIDSHGAGIIVGSDCPSVDPAYVHKAAALLEQLDVVLGPADDGGFVLIGARTTRDGMLEGIDWGSSGVLEQTLARFHEKGLRCECLEPLWDVDEPEDWARFLSDGAGSTG